MAMDQKERSAKTALKRKLVAEKELRHRVRPGIEQALNRVRQRGKMPIVSEVLQIAIMKMDLMDDEELDAFLTYPRHEIVVSESVARAIYDAGVRNILSADQDESDEVISPLAINCCD
ncbi:hypothetical protein [Pseudomonas syringae]|uniref:Uncharacterized protein n=1 Tax=Pseudomonas syringae pv. syringae (strain B728a) TaxID=205918 RepID=Q4ZSI4_PSEU2|nr:hypothetical protein [Pseudomonas syringae]AAY37888.1 conserved hypothetical protein [Pseudomonas syringae pv. syringae B728a]PYD18444.1 hypothetical protein DND47_04720 [Pseudomonas syringae pv. syringae]